jgi:hypothetical protein
MDLQIDVDRFLYEHASKLTPADHTELEIFSVPVLTHAANIH